MWDEVAAAVWLDLALGTRRETMLVDVDTAFTANYGGVLSWPLGRGPGLGEQALEVVLDVDVARVEDLALRLLCGDPDFEAPAHMPALAHVVSLPR
ncbi:hypothetical protein [Variovorax rhizosphaerae]|uniref:Uncharacterized protein n=1 Tax=Variovorax rhizosphaerae TaxID=1836200 RepID=A0ABU8WMP9_9BURK